MLICFRRLPGGALLLLGFLLGTLTGCAPRSVPSDTALGDAGPAALVLRAVTLGPVGLPFGSSTEVEVELVDEAGLPQGGELITFALDGAPADTSLAGLEATTDGAGRARVRLLAGERSASFRLRAIHALASPVWIDVTVAASFGRLTVRPLYEGVRPVERWTVAVSRGDCAAALAAIDGGFRRVISAPTGDARLDALATDVTYAVVVRAFAGVQLTATGCTAGVGILADRETVLEVPATSSPLALAGDYEVALTLDTTEAVRPLLEAFVLDAQARVGTPDDDARRFLDALETELTGDADGLSALARLRSAGALETIASSLVLDANAPSQALGDLLAQAAVELYDLRAEGSLVVLSGDVPDFVLRRVVAGSGSASPLTLSLPAVGTSLILAVTFSPDSDQLFVDRVSLPLPLGAALGAAIEGKRTAAGASSVVEILGVDPCTAVSLFVATDPMLAGACDADCVAQACASGVEQALAEALLSPDAVDGLDVVRQRLELSGSIEARDADGDLTVDTLTGALDGSYLGTDGTGGPVTGQLSAARPLD